MAISESTTVTGVESDDEWGYVTSGTGNNRWDGGGGANNDQGGNGQRHVIVVDVGDLCDWGGMPPSLLRGRPWLN